MHWTPKPHWQATNHLSNIHLSGDKIMCVASFHPCPGLKVFVVASVQVSPTFQLFLAMLASLAMSKLLATKLAAGLQESLLDLSRYLSLFCFTGSFVSLESTNRELLHCHHYLIYHFFHLNHLPRKLRKNYRSSLSHLNSNRPIF